MKNFYTIYLVLVSLIIFILFIPNELNAQQDIPFQFVSPKPNSIMVSNVRTLFLDMLLNYKNPLSTRF